MSHPLEEKVRTVARRAFWLRFAQGLAWTVCIAAAAIFLCGTADYLLRFRDAGVRAICSLAVVAASAWAVWKYLFPALARTLSLVQVAQRIERRFPVLQGGLSSSLEFLSQELDEPTAGSPQLRRAVVAEITASAERLDFTAVCDPTAARKAVTAATLACVVMGAICLLDVRAAALAVQRLAVPWGSVEWPRRHHLKFEQIPDHLAAGNDFESLVTDSHGQPLPDDVTIYYWFDGDDASAIQKHAMRPLGTAVAHRLDRVTRSFRVRVSGGDDDSLPWHAVKVVDAPRIVRATTRIVPPAYSGLPTETARQQVRALAGSTLEIEATVDKPLATAAFRREKKSESKSANLTHAAKLSAGGKQIHFPASTATPFVIADSGTYFFELTDLDGLTGGEESRWTIRAIPDSAPTVAIEKPNSQSMVTPNAQVRLKVLVKDDLAIQKVELQFVPPNTEPAAPLERQSSADAASDPPPATTQLAAQPATSSPPTEERLSLFSADTPPAARGEQGESRVIEYSWDLAQIPNLTPGGVLEFSVAATDFKPQTGRSPVMRLTIISPDDFDDKIAQRQALILNQLNETLRLERDCRTQTTSLEIQVREANRFEQRDVDLLQSAELNQRQVRRHLGPDADGALAQIASLLSDLETNRVANSEVATRMQTLQTELGRLHRDELPVVERELVSTVKIARQVSDPAKTASAASQSLAEAGRRQDEVIGTLERLLGELSQWDHYRRFAREVARLRRDQEQLQTQTSERMASKSLSKPLEKLSSQEIADLKRLAERQTDLTRRLEKLQGQMRKMGDELGESDPLAAQTLADALDAAQRSAAAGQMRQAAQEISQNRIGQAAETQRDAARGLTEIENVLANRREQELSRLTKKLSEAAGELSGLRQKQTGLKKRLEAAAKIPDENILRRDLKRLAKEERQLAEETARMARKLERLQAQRTADAAKQAAGRQEQSAASGEQGESGSALAEATQAERALEEAEQKLAEERRQAEADLLREQLASIEQTIGGLLKRQRAVVAETKRLEELRRNAKQPLTPAQQESVAVVANQQRDVATDTTALEDGLGPAETFKLALRGAVSEMLRATVFLDRGETDEGAQQAEQHAAARLEQMLAALKPDSPGSPDGPPKPGDQQQPPPGEQSLRGLAELKLLHLMQQEINRRTSDLESRRRQGKPLSVDQERELNHLADEQGRLAEMVLKLSRGNGS